MLLLIRRSTSLRSTPGIVHRLWSAGFERKLLPDPSFLKEIDGEPASSKEGYSTNGWLHGVWGLEVGDQHLVLQEVSSSKWEPDGNGHGDFGHCWRFRQLLFHVETSYRPHFWKKNSLFHFWLSQLLSPYASWPWRLFPFQLLPGPLRRSSI